MNRFEELFARYPQLEVCKDDIQKSIDAIIECYKAGGKVMICGNGGSSSDSGHIVGELMKGFLKMRPLSEEKRAEMKKNNPEISDELMDNLQGSLSAINLTENSALVSAFANDCDPKLSYAQQVLGHARKGDVLIGLSTSGNSGNVIDACHVAKALGITTITLTGRDGGILKRMSDIGVVVPEQETFKIQELHLPVYHCICAMVEEYFYKK